MFVLVVAVGIIWRSNIEEATEDGSNVILVKLVLSFVEGTGKDVSFSGYRWILSRKCDVHLYFSLREHIKMKARTWPFRPDHITMDGDRLFLDDLKKLRFGSLSNEYLWTLRKRWEGLKKLTGVGIIANAHLEALQTTICVNLGNPTTVIEFSPQGEPVRTDSKLLFWAMHDPCRIFRFHTEEQLCLDCDCRHARIFYGLKRDALDRELEDSAAFCECRKEYHARGVHFAVIKNAKRPYLEYDCPLLGYRELVFPVFFEEKVIATFFVGQLCLHYALNKITNQQKNFFGTPTPALMRLLPDLNDRQKAAMEVMQAHQDWITDTSHIMDNDEYTSFIEIAINELEQLERALSEQMRLQRDVYVRGKMDLLVKKFREGLTPSSDIAKERWERLWKNVVARIDELIKDFEIRYIIVFAGKGLGPDPDTTLEVVAHGGEIPSVLQQAITSSQLTFNMEQLSTHVRSQWIASTESPSLLVAVKAPGWMATEKDLVRIFPVPFFPKVTLAALLGYWDSNPLKSEENTPGSQLSRALQTFYSVILSTLSATLANLADELRDKALGRLTHEFEVPIIAIRGATQSIMDTPSACKYFKEDYAGDIWSWTELMARLVDNADVYRYARKGDLTIDVSTVYLLTDVVAPSIRQVKLLLDARGFSSEGISYSGFENIPELFLDRNRFQQIMFNLLSNSIKYAFDDPKAFQVEIAASESGGKFLIFARDWGPGIDPKYAERVFEEEFRIETAVNRYVAGQGLGLWIVRQIIEKHRGTIEIVNFQNPITFKISLPYWLTSRSPG